MRRVKAGRTLARRRSFNLCLVLCADGALQKQKTGAVLPEPDGVARRERLAQGRRHGAPLSRRGGRPSRAE